MPALLLSSLRFALRSFRRSPGFTGLAVALLGIGIGSSTALFSVVKGALLDPWPYAGFRRIVTVKMEYPRMSPARAETLSPPEYFDVAGENGVFETVMAGVARNVNLTGGGAPVRLHAVAVTANTFRMLGVPPAAGRVFREDEDRPGAADVVVMGNRLWRDRFHSDPAVIGRTVRVEGRPYVVLGVMPRRFLWWDANLYFPLRLDPGSRDRAERTLYCQGTLRAGISHARAEAALGGLARRWDREWGARYPEYREARFQVRGLVDEVLRDLRPILWILLAAVGLVLLVACANVANLFAARTARRGREIAIRRSLGASRAAILLQFLVESSVICAMSCGVALAVARVLLTRILSLIPYGYVPAEAGVRIDLAAFALAAVLGGASATWLGLAPGLRAIAGDGSVSSAAPRARPSARLFVGAQAAAAVLILAAAGTALAAVRHLLAAPTGARNGDATTFRVAVPRDADGRTPDSSRTFGEILRRLDEIPRVRAAGGASALPLEPAPAHRVVLESSAAEGSAPVFAAVRIATAGDYFQAAGIPIQAGRALGRRDSSESRRVAAVSRTMAEKFWPGQDPIGKRFRRAESGEWRTVVGVVGDVRQQSIDSPMAPQYYVPASTLETSPTGLAFVVWTGRPDAIASEVRRAVANVDGSLPAFALGTLRGATYDALGGRRLARLLISIFAAIVLCLSVMGTYSIVALSVAQRTREIGIRTALGSTPRGIVRLLIRESSQAVFAGGIAGLAVWLAAGRRALSALGDPGLPLATGAAAALVMAGAGLLAAYLPSRRAARIDPLQALRYE